MSIAKERRKTMPALKTIVLNLKDKAKVVIPITNAKGKAFNFSELTANNDVKSIRLEFEKSADRNYTVTKSKCSIYRREVPKTSFDTYIKKMDRKKTRD